MFFHTKKQSFSPSIIDFPPTNQRVNDSTKNVPRWKQWSYP